MERKTLIPASEKQFSEAVEGDIVKVTLSGMSFWCLYKGMHWEKHIFRRQIPPSGPVNESLVEDTLASRDGLRFDRNLGVVINTFFNDVSYKTSISEGYDQAVEELKRANLWS